MAFEEGQRVNVRHRVWVTRACHQCEQDFGFYKWITNRVTYEYGVCHLCAAKQWASRNRVRLDAARGGKGE